MRQYNLPGLANVNVELTNRCNKRCWMCGRRKIERDYPELTLNYGDMDFSLVEAIAEQLPPNITVQLHDNGDPCLYPRLGDAIKLFHRQLTSFDTNGKLLVEKADDIIDNLDTMAISVFENDDEGDEQYGLIEKFVQLKGSRKPYTILRLNGEVDVARYEKMGLLIARRILHSPLGSFNYQKRNPTIPEIGICLDFLYHLAIKRDGRVAPCVRFDPKGLGVLGNVKDQSLEEIWNGEKRMIWLESHKHGRRDSIPLCSYCHYWGVPTGGDYRVQVAHVDEQGVFVSKQV